MTFCQKNAYNDELVVQYKGPREEPIPPELDLGDFCPINLTPLITFSCHKGNLLLNVESMREVFMTCLTINMAILRSILAFMPS